MDFLVESVEWNRYGTYNIIRAGEAGEGEGERGGLDF
jgi:hypothetical protein